MTATDRTLRAAVTAGLAVPPSPHPDITLSRPTAEVLRVRYRGWVAEVRGATVVVPQQNCPRGADPTDLITCLAVAASFRAGAHCVDPGASSPAAPDSGAQAAAAILRGAAAVAEQGWDRRGRDIYTCLRVSWAGHGHAVAYAGLTAALRALVPQGNLLAYNDTQLTGADIAALFRRAAAMVERRTAERGTSRGAA